MSEFSESIKKFDKVRDYMRDFFIYGYKTRSDFQYNSLRSYDNERRRIESWLGDLIRFDNSKKGKQISISIDSGQLSTNPLYKAFESKSFTDNDIHLHFFILDILQNTKELSLEELTDRMNEDYGQYFEPQTIRLKLREYVKDGILIQKKCGRAFFYSLSDDNAQTIGVDFKRFTDAIAFFFQSAPFGVVGNYLLNQHDINNNMFLFKHNFIVHTLEDNILLSLINAMENKCLVEIMNFGRQKQESFSTGIPLKILESTQTGRRYIILYIPSLKRFNSFRIDYIKSVKCLDTDENYDEFYEKLENNSQYCWGVSFGSIDPNARKEQFKMLLYIDETQEQYIINRLEREGKNGIIKHIGKNTYSYSIEVYDTNEMMSWVKSFIGRIISIEGTNKPVIQKFYKDIIKMEQMYRDKD